VVVVFRCMPRPPVVRRLLSAYSVRSPYMGSAELRFTQPQLRAARVGLERRRTRGTGPSVTQQQNKC